MKPEITYEIECLPEGSPVSICTGDYVADAICEDLIRKDLPHNEWAWCCVRVTATVSGVMNQGSVEIDCCSHGSEAIFRGDVLLYDSMKKEARDNLLSSMRKTVTHYENIMIELEEED